MTSTATIFGSTGLVGSFILSTVASLDAFKAIQTISRRAPKTQSPKLTATIEPDTTKWASSLSSSKPTPDVVFSALGTTRQAAGGIANQWKIDHDLNVELAKTAHAAGVKTFVFVSSAGTDTILGSYLPYSKMKNGVEESIKSLAFDQAIILRPGIIIGDREVPHLGGPLLMSLIHGIGKVSRGWQDSWGQDADVIGRAAVHAATLAAEGKAPSKYWILGSDDIVKLGRDEWKA